MTQTRTQARKEKEEVLKILDQADKDFGVGLETSSEMELLFNSDEDSEKKTLSVGDIVKGHVVDIQNDFVLIDVGYKSEGICSLGDFSVVEGKPQIKVGDAIEVFVDNLENENGMITLSKNKADIQKVWAELTESADQEKIIEGVLVDKVKGGFKVDIGVKAFLPGSQVDFKIAKNFDSFVGQKMKFKIVKFNKKRGNIVLSHRVLMDEDRKKINQDNKIEEGAVVKGVAKNITDYGVFLDLGGLDGLLHITDMSWSRVKHPSQIVSIGDQIDVKVLKFDSEKQRVSLGLKQLQEDPWSSISSKYPEGTTLTAKVLNLTDYGVFVELEKGIEGFIHITELSWEKKVRNPNQICKVDDEIKVVVVGLDTQNRRITLSYKKLKKNPWSEIETKYPIGSQHEVKIIGIADFGVFVELEKEIEGLIHISELSVKRIENISESYKVGDKLKAEVIALDKDFQKINFSVKAIQMTSSQTSSSSHSSHSSNNSESNAGFSNILGKTLGLFNKKEESESEEKKSDKKDDSSDSSNE